MRAACIALVETRQGDCGCPEEVYDCGGIDLIVHFEHDGVAHAFMDGGDWGEAEAAFWAPSIAMARATALNWARCKTSGGGVYVICTRPALRYLGGKWKLAPRVIAEFPAHRVYVEPFAGAASVLMRKPRSQGECLNDLSADIVNLFRVLRDRPLAAELCRLLSITPFARQEYDVAFEPTDDAVEAARRLVVRSYMGHGSSAAVAERATGFRASLVNRSGALPAGEWPRLPPALAAISERLQGVLIEHRPAEQVIARYDHPDVLFYVDPPYVPETRSAKRKGGRAFHAYAHEMDETAHAALLMQLRRLTGAVVLSGYACQLYDDLLADWDRIEIATHADGALPRTEVLWVNARARTAPRLVGVAA